MPRNVPKGLPRHDMSSSDVLVTVSEADMPVYHQTPQNHEGNPRHLSSSFENFTINNNNNNNNNINFDDDNDDQNNSDNQPLSPLQRKQQQKQSQRRRQRRNSIQHSLLVVPVTVAVLLCLGVILGTIGTILGIVNVVHDNNPQVACSNDCKSSSEQASKESALETVRKRGYLKCGTGPANSPGFLFNTGNNNKNDENTTYAGLELDLCLVLTSALFSGELEEKPNADSGAADVSKPRYRIVVPAAATTESSSSLPSFDAQWQALANDEVDVLFRAPYTMENDVLEPTTQQGFEFSMPYFWDGLALGGLPEHVACAEALDFNSTDTCQATKICVSSMAAPNHVAILKDILRIPTMHLVLVPGTEVVSGSTISFPDACNVLAGTMSTIHAGAVQEQGYIGPYELSTITLSKEPIAVATKQGDARWSDFVKWVLEALVNAEEFGITKELAFDRLESTDLFDLDAADSVSSNTGTAADQVQTMWPLKDMFRHAVAARGNYGEVYNANLQTLLPRSGANLLNRGDSPIMFAYPYGNLTSASDYSPQLELESPTVRAIKARGFLKCGMNARTGFAQFHPNTRIWSGLDIDLCRALAAALFDGADDHVLFTDVPAAQRFSLLVNGHADVLARLTTVTLERDVKEPTTGQGLSFASPYLYDRLVFGGVPPFDQCAHQLDVISPHCQSLIVCVLQGTTMFSRIQSLIRDDYLSPRLKLEDVIQGLEDGSCNAIAGGFQDVAEATVRLYGYTGNYSVGEGQQYAEQDTQDPLALTTRQDDPLWSDFVRWIQWSLMYAEAHGITRETARSQMPTTTLFGPLQRLAFAHAVSAVGNFGQVYARHFEPIAPRSGTQLLNTGNGPMMHSMPGIPRRSANSNV